MKPNKSLRGTNSYSVSPKNLNGDTQDYLIVVKKYIGQLMDRAERLLPNTKDKYGLRQCRFIRTKEPRMCSCCGKMIKVDSYCIQSYLKVGKNCSNTSGYKRIYTCGRCIDRNIQMAEVYNQELLLIASDSESYRNLEDWLTRPL